MALMLPAASTECRILHLSPYGQWPRASNMHISGSSSRGPPGRSVFTPFPGAPPDPKLPPLPWRPLPSITREYLQSSPKRHAPLFKKL